VETYCRRARQLLKWLYTSGRLPIDLSQWLPKPADPPARTRVLRADEIVKLFAAIPDSFRVRNMALLAFLIETGARRMEAANVRWQDVEHAADTYRGAAYLPKTKGYLRTDKTRTVVFGEVTGKLLQMLRVVQSPSADERVFRISNVGVRQVMETLADRADVRFSAHDLRRTFSTYWMRTCVAPNPSLAEQLLNFQLGHTSERKATVARKHYIVLDPTDVLRYYVSPLDDVALSGLNR
jgi:integrase